MKKIAFIIFITFCISNIYAQQDSLKTLSLEEIVVTATRYEKLLSAVPMPVLLISQKQIQAMGSLRLNEVLQEQTGLAIVNDHGQGIQMQGFNPDYTLILVDGEPLIGRTAGTLELSRIAVGNIKQIEIVKGPSSSLYGSEALAGVVNIITENPKETKLNLSSRYGANETLDISTSLNYKKNKLGIYAFIDRYSTEGYDFSPETFGKTVEAFYNYTFQSKLHYDLTEKIKFTISGRYFNEFQQNNFDIGTEQMPNRITGNGKVQDWNINPVIHWRKNNFKTQFRFYASQYQTQSKLNYQANNELYDETVFKQNFQRPEIQSEYYLNQNHVFTLGIGKIWESVEATRYTDVKRFSTNYAFLQYEFTPTKAWNIIFGGRFDQHSSYGSQFSPKIAIQYDLSNKISFKASAGMGFKAPDFRQLYLNFNNAVAGYSVFGSEELPNALQQLINQNQIAEILLAPSQIGNLRAESSVAYNLGVKLKPNEKLNININFFRNDISNLIETQAVARKNNGQSVFSYRNLNEVFTQGFETDLNYRLNKNLTFSAGYQYLLAKDKNVIKQIANGELFSRDPQTLVTTRLSTDDYGGLFNRSRNMWNIKLFYENLKHNFSANIRGIYRGKYGLGDRNGNLILDQDYEYVQGFMTWNVAVAKEFFNKKLRFQAGLDNVLDYKDTQNIPNLAGRLWYFSVITQL
ncbi:MAG: TonB-dependent receptor [Bacteroidetes bacterium]|nr:MAG: TonB-dependent receptor [Bacteroidota bacterium]